MSGHLFTDANARPKLLSPGVISREISPRVYAREHTGLLERKDREELEHDFKEHPHSNSVNALSATSTLEMGIDIGDLNVVGNTSVSS